MRRPKGVPEASRRPNVTANERDDLGVATGKNILRAARGGAGVIRRPNAAFTEGLCVPGLILRLIHRVIPGSKGDPGGGGH